MSTILGCPITAILSLYDACPVTNAPACATATPPSSWDAGCCTSLDNFAISVGSCYAKNAPACLDTSAAYASLTGANTEANVCTNFLPAGTNPAAGTAAVTIGGSTTGTKTGTAASKTAAAVKVNAVGLKVYIGAALIGALAVLSL